MRTAIWHNNEDIRIEEVPTPHPGPGEILVKVHACGICGSDVVEWYRLPRAPLVPGHEMGGEVVEVGPSVEDWRPGDRVFVAPKVPCMQCRHCRAGHYPVCSGVKERMPGALAEYVLVPSVIVDGGTYRLPENLTYEQATFIEPLACVCRAQNLAQIEEGQEVLVMGCGMSGILHIQLAVRKGCHVTATDVNPARLALAARLGAEPVIHAEEDIAERLAACRGSKADVVMLCTAALSAVEQAWKCVDKGGAIVFFAVPGPEKSVTVPINSFWTREIRILTSYYCGPADIAEAIELLKSAKIGTDDLVTHRLPLGAVGEGFRLVLQGRDSLKVVIHPNL